MMPFEGRVALVTGASRGIGAASAITLAKGGATVVITARSLEGLQPTWNAISQTPGRAIPIAVDMQDYHGLQTLAERIHDEFGRLDILVANAGVLGTPQPVAEVDDESWQELLATNLTANLHLIRLFDPLLQNSNAGRAVFITSGLARRRVPGVGVYAATKAALNALIRVYAAELDPAKPLRVNLFSPGATLTDLYATAFAGADLSALPHPDQVSRKIADLCLPSVTENGSLFDFRTDRWIEY